MYLFITNDAAILMHLAQKPNVFKYLQIDDGSK